MTTDDEYDHDVLVVGTGPTGATTALALADQGVDVLVISKFNGPSSTPRAHITNQRAGEVLRDLGVEQEALEQGTPWGQMGDMLFTTSLAGPEIARLRAWGTGDQRRGDYLKSSPCGLIDLPQHLLEPILIRHAAARGAHVAFNTEFLRLDQDDQGVTVRLLDRVSGSQSAVRVRYLVGADGANSSVAADVGIPIDGELARAGTVYTQFRADLSRYVAHRPSTLYWVMNPEAGFGEIGMGLLRAVRPWDEWIAGWGFDLKNGEPDLDAGRAAEKIRTLIGEADVPIEITGVAPWYVNRAAAAEYREGRVLCAGDAVHRHPPSSGLGSNTCLQDAHNLAWKLAFVLKGWAGDGLLQSYSAERAPVGAEVVQRANQSRVEYAPLRAAFAVPGSTDPVPDGIAQLAAPTPAGEQARQELRAALALKDYEFNAEGTELNRRYTSSAVLPDPDATPEEFVDRQLYAQASTRPGAKLPHAWLVGGDGTRISTLDVVGGGSLTLLTGLAGAIWRDAADALDLPCLRSIVIGEPGAADLYFEWHDVRDAPEGTAFLVRPDGVIAWRDQHVPGDTAAAVARLASALGRLLDIEQPHADVADDGSTAATADRQHAEALR